MLARTRNAKGPSVSGFSNVASFNQPSHLKFESNLLYQWAGSGQTYFTQTSGFVGQVHTSYESNRWGDPALGTNTNSDGLTFPNAYTGLQLFAALGCSDKATCAAKMVETPELNWGAKARAILFAGYAIQLGAAK